MGLVLIKHKAFIEVANSQFFVKDSMALFASYKLIDDLLLLLIVGSFEALVDEQPCLEF